MAKTKLTAQEQEALRKKKEIEKAEKREQRRLQKQQSLQVAEQRKMEKQALNEQILAKKEQQRREKLALAEQKRQQKQQSAQNKPSKEQRKQQKRELRKQRRQARIDAKQKRHDEAFAKLSPDEQMELTLESIAQLQQQYKKWYKLDNAALMYPMVSRGESPAVFRMAVQLKEPVNPVVLQYALNDVYPRFPTICGTVVWGWFWPYVDKPASPIVVKKQTKVPGRPIAVDARRSQIRVNYFGNQIAVEFFHSATDGTGGIIFLNSLLKCYFARLGIDCERVNCCDHRDKPTIDEVRDNFATIAVRKNPPPVPPVIKAKAIKGTVMKNGKYMTYRGICSAKQLHEVAKSHNATVTEFLGAVELFALNKLVQTTGLDDKRPLRVLIPVNLRKLYNVDTLRNFTSYIFYQYNGQSDLDELIADIQQQAKEQMTDDYFRGMVSFNYNSGNHPLLKPVPLPIKRMVVSAVVNGRGEGVVNSSCLSNVGVVKAPKEFEDLIVRYEFTMGKPYRNTNCFSVATFNDVCVISIMSKYEEHDCEREFFSMLADLGVDVAIESDIWEDEQ